MISIITNYTLIFTLTLLLLLPVKFVIGLIEDENTVQFPHESCRSELHTKFKFTTFHNANPFYDEEGTFEMIVRFKGVSDGHIGLTEYENASEPLYVIFIGSYENKMTEIRRTLGKKSESKMDTPNILTNEQWRGFLIRYNVNNGHLSILPEGMDLPLVEWIDPKPLNITFYSFRTYSVDDNRILQVAFDCRAKDIFSSIPKITGVCQIKYVSGDSFDVFYNLDPFFNNNGVLEILVRFRGPSDGHIFLTTTKNDSNGGYLVVIGSFGNTKSEIRRSKWTASVFKINTPNIMSDFQFRGFLIHYYRETGTLRVYSEGSEMPLLHWKDDKPLAIQYISFSAYYNIAIHVAFNCRPKDIHSVIPRHSNTGDLSIIFSFTEFKEKVTFDGWR